MLGLFLFNCDEKPASGVSKLSGRLIKVHMMFILLIYFMEYRAAINHVPFVTSLSYDNFGKQLNSFCVSLSFVKLDCELRLAALYPVH